MTSANQKLRDALRRIEATAADALAHQPDGDDTCRAHLMQAMQIVVDAAADTVREVLELRCDDLPAPRRGVPEAQKPPRQETGPSPAILEGTR
jgi:hypothetical protein